MILRYTSVVSTAAPFTRLTTLDVVMDELGIDESGTYDLMLLRKIDEASSDIEAHIPRKLAKCGITETIWPQEGYACVDCLILRRAPVATITSIVQDGVTLSVSDYRLDAENGYLYRRSNGTAIKWQWSNDIVVVHEAGFIMPEHNDYQSGDPASLPAALQSAALELVSSFWASRGRDPTIMEEENPGVSRFRYWVGAVGEKGELPPSVMAKITPFRRLGMP